MANIIHVATGSSGISLHQLQGLQKEIYLQLQTSREMFQYLSDLELYFDLKLRENIVRAALDQNQSGVSFSSFHHSSFNPNFWVKTENGYLLRPDVLPADAISDMFINGHLYGFECSTAIVIVYYKAVLDSIRESAFNYLFSGLLVWNWNNDPDMVIHTRKGEEFVIGDVVYFNNPDYREPIWRGVNAVVLENAKYYGHGVGVKSATEMIEALNTLRKVGSTKSAYMLKQHSRLNVRYLHRFAKW